MKSVINSRRWGALLSLLILMGLLLSAGTDVSHVQELQLRGQAETPSLTFTVTNTADSGTGSLRQAITSANAAAGLDTIVFNIAGSGIHFIFVPSPLPTITDPVIIDGATQPGYSGTPLIHLEGMGTGRALDIAGGGSTVRGLSFTSFFAGAVNGIVRLSGPGNNIITACNFGVRGDNTRPTTASTGLLIDGSNGNRIGGSTAAERNYFVIGSEHNLVIQNGGANNRVVGNWFGTGPNGVRMDSSGRDALRIINSPNNIIGGSVGTTPGGACTGECNLVTGAGNNGILINGSAASGNRVLGNFIGLFADGASVNQNNLGLRVENSPGTIIGGTTAAERNVITGNSGLANVHVTGAGSTGTVITGNYIGLFTNGTATPTTADATNDGILVNAGAAGTRIGGLTPGERNVISGLRNNGIELAGANGTIITGNYIGTDVTGMVRSTTVANGIGVFFSNNNTIGGTAGTTYGGPCTGACNVISGNGNDGASHGVLLREADGNTIDGNYIGLNALGSAAILNGRNPSGSVFNGDAIALLNASNNVIGRRRTQSVQRRTIESPSVSRCVQGEDNKAYIRFDDRTGSFLAAICPYDPDTNTPALNAFSGTGDISGEGFDLFLTTQTGSLGYARAYIDLDNDRGGGDVTLPDGRSAHIYDSIPGNSTCRCPQADKQRIVGTLEMASADSQTSDNNLISEMFFNQDNLGEPIDGQQLVPERPAINILGGNGNRLERLDMFGGIESNIQIDPGNFDNTIGLFDLGLEVPEPPPIDLLGDANRSILPPNVNVARTSDGFTVSGVITGPPNTRYQIRLAGHDIRPETFDTEADVSDTDLEIFFDVTTDSMGTAVILQTYTGIERYELLRYDFITAAATQMSDVPGAEGFALRSSSELSTPRRVPQPKYDFDEDGKTDLATYRPGSTAGAMSLWKVQGSRANAITDVQFGSGEDRVVPGDFNGDNIVDFAVWRPSTGFWFIARPTGTPSSNFDAFQWGTSTDTPVSGDFDDDGRNDLAVFRPSQGIWYIRESLSGNLLARQWGIATDRVVPADYNGDGATEIAVYRDGVWYITPCAACPARIEFFGLASDIPVPADFDGDGRDDIAVFRPSTGIWYVQRSTAGFTGVQWGLATDIPVNGDFDSDGKTDFSIWRPSTGTWWILRSSDGGVRSIPLGQLGDIPVTRFQNSP